MWKLTKKAKESKEHKEKVKEYKEYLEKAEEAKEYFNVSSIFSGRFGSDVNGFWHDVFVATNKEDYNAEEINFSLDEVLEDKIQIEKIKEAVKLLHDLEINVYNKIVDKEDFED